MISSKIGHRLDSPISKLIKLIFKTNNLNPTYFTLLGLLVNIFAAAAFICGKWLVAGLLILAAGFFDMLDGAVARTFGRVTKYGGFLDSVIDRYSDLVLLIGLIIYYASNHNMHLLTLTAIVSVGTILIPYTRARAEVFIPHCDVGIMERAERIILLAAGGIIQCVFNIMPIVLWILAIFTHLTVFHRIYFTWKEAQKL
ncbi:MAG: CDP-alcohol phosphatidyltransferase family protein [Deltaproteobacteria bacterium]|nr:CDP-alcohol phosphatidyltransferase family protein [Deltaproteobacteria bacterium]